MGLEVEAESREHAEQAALCLVAKALSPDSEYYDFGDQVQDATILKRPGIIVKPVRNPIVEEVVS